MKIEIKKKVFNKYLERFEIEAIITIEGEEKPKINEIREALAKTAGEEGEPIILVAKYIYGGKRIKVIGRIYKNKELINKIEPEFVIKKNYGEATAEKA